MSNDDDDEDKLTELEERIRDREVARGERPPVPEDPTDLPHSADEYYMRMLEHAEGEADYPYAEDRFEALEKERERLA